MPGITRNAHKRLLENNNISMQTGTLLNHNCAHYNESSVWFVPKSGVIDIFNVYGLQEGSWSSINLDS